MVRNSSQKSRNKWLRNRNKAKKQKNANDCSKSNTS